MQGIIKIIGMFLISSAIGLFFLLQDVVAQQSTSAAINSVSSKSGSIEELKSRRAEIEKLKDISAGLKAESLKLIDGAIENLNLAANKSTINASPQQIGQVIMNLVNNAVESIINAPDFQERLNQPTPFGGEISIDTYNREENIIISVKDNGPGISESDLEKVFDPFFTREKTMGVGIGLSICHGIIKDHKGAMYANNLQQGGDAFTIRIQLSKSCSTRDNKL